MKTEITHTPEEAARWFNGILKNEQDRRRCLELLTEHYPDGLPENPNEEINATLYQAFPQLWGKNVGELSFAQRYPLIRDALAYQKGITERVSTGQPTAGKDDGKLEKNKPETWGYDRDGNFTINGEKATKKQSQLVCKDLRMPEKFRDLLPEVEKRAQSLASRHSLRLKGSLPENYLELLPRIEAQARNLPSRRVSNNPLEPFRELAQSLTKGPIKAPPNEEPDSNVDLFFRLAVLQAKREGITPEQLVYELLERKKTSESTDGGNKITVSEGALKNDTVPAGSTERNTPRRYTRKTQAEAIAKDKFKVLWRIDNKKEWARRIGCHRSTIGRLQSWHRAEKRRNGWKQIATRLGSSIDPALIEALYTSDASAIGKLSAEDRDNLDSLPDKDRAEIIELLTEAARDAIS